MKKWELGEIKSLSLQDKKELKRACSSVSSSMAIVALEKLERELEGAIEPIRISEIQEKMNRMRKIILNALQAGDSFRFTYAPQNEEEEE